MSIASSIPSIKIKISPSSPFHHHSSKLSFKPKSTISIIKSSQADGPLRRPSTPSLSPPPPSPSSSPSLSPTPPLKPSTQTPSPPKPKDFVVTLEYQRKVAKELQDYFKLKKLEEADQGPFFGFMTKNEISNGRWAMFGFAVGLLTEYATGSDFVQQVKILLSNFGVVDLE
ncbi:Chlorophyll A-B binding protein [Dioscorea alata]|uniref:Chlorophyll A-B binding protein n=1 Tax=Dioscorea alata TaxID=55571 RepID=A0ACB7UAL6_DIOAL|nr:Chlorophyll A-B binding protein [Dioscorea alata]